MESQSFRLFLETHLSFYIFHTTGARVFGNYLNFFWILIVLNSLWLFLFMLFTVSQQPLLSEQSFLIPKSAAIAVLTCLALIGFSSGISLFSSLTDIYQPLLFFLMVTVRILKPVGNGLELKNFIHPTQVI